ncbi:MAG: hypothetical protein ABIH37_01955 [archaeon]
MVIKLIFPENMIIKIPEKIMFGDFELLEEIYLDQDVDTPCSGFEASAPSSFMDRAFGF